MRCPRCQAELSDSATTCNQCGAAIRQGSYSAFSYLPAGTPPWPISVPPKPYAEAPVAIQSGPADSNNTTTGPTKRSTRSVLTIVGLLILTPLLGSLLTFTINSTQGTSTPKSVPNVNAIPTVGAQPSATATTQSQQLPTPTSFKNVTNNDVNVAFQYPADWQVEPPQKTQNLSGLEVHPQQQLGIDFVIAHYTASASAQVSSPDSLNQSQIQGFSSIQGVSNVQVTPSSSKQQTIGGTTWSELEGSFTGGNDKYHVLTASVRHGDTYYSFVFSAPEIYYQEATDKYLKHMLDTFKFLA
ncbi:MAG: zinc ribbon domain-containing protein [Ktedonobacteraceae bacterium]|nr:zinc ribbon domain-containing protein [Ktedonobacteraceae bacterium]